MGISVLNEQDYYRIVYGGWLGKNIGGTLGAPVEGVKELLTLTYYPELPDGPLENDDLDLQLVWLHALEQYGPELTARELGQEWLEHVFFPFDEYGYALTNLRRGLIPPVAGSFNNPFTNCMGSPIRSEIWAMVAPGMPEAAAHYAYQDAIVDHAGGEGVYGEMFFAALESAIFFEKDRDRLIEIALKYIPDHCRTFKAVIDLLKWHKEGKDWLEARELILKHHGNDNFTDAPQNIAFTLLGWLYGVDFEDALLKSVNCGYDTDCTAATLGAILGMLLGPDGLPEKWVKPIGDRIVVSPAIKGFPAPKSLDELTRRTIRMGKRVIAAWGADLIVHPDLPMTWSRQEGSLETVRALWQRKATSNVYLLPQGSRSSADITLEIDYGHDGPAIGAGQRKTLQIIFTNRSQTLLTGTLSLLLPEGWNGPSTLDVSLQPEQSVQMEAEITASENQAIYYDLAFRWSRTHDNSVWSEQTIPFTLVGASRWTLSGPGSGEGKAVHIPGNRLEWESTLGISSDGVYRAQTTVYNPSARKLRLITASSGPVTLKLNGQPVITCEQQMEFMPAYHRANAEQMVELSLPAGTHDVELIATRDGFPLQVFILAVALKQTQSPGPHYYYTDILWGK